MIVGDVNDEEKMVNRTRRKFHTIKVIMYESCNDDYKIVVLSIIRI